jgi:hypothetical protein
VGTQDAELSTEYEVLRVGTGYSVLITLPPSVSHPYELEFQVLLLILTLIIITLALIGALWIGTLWIQSYLYSAPIEDLQWRAPAAGAALGALIAVWCILAYRSPESFTPLTEFSPDNVERFEWFKAIKKQDGKTVEVDYERRGAEFINPRNQRRFTPADSEGVVEAIIAGNWKYEQKKAEGGEYRSKVGPDPGTVVRFNAEMSPDGKPLRYLEENGGREMTIELVGNVYTRSYGLLLTYVFLHLFFFVLWVVCLWLLLHYQFWHAFGFGAICWAVMTFAVMPLLLEQAAAAGRPQLPEAPAYSQVW